MQSHDDLPPFADQFRPRWPGDVGGYTAEQMRAYRAEGVAQERERCAKVCDDLEVSIWHQYKKERRNNSHTEGRSDGAGECAAAIRAGHATS
jgi:hypothetical protein